jgi:hypothetical protein
MVVIEVEFDEVVVTAPTLIGKVIAKRGMTPEIYTGKPVFIRTVLPLFLKITKRPKIPAHVVEYTVKDNAYAVFVKRVGNLFEVLICAESAVELEVIGGVISVFGGLKERTEKHGVEVTADKVGNPFDNLEDSPGCAVVVFAETLRSAEIQGIQMVYIRAFYPT